MSTTALERTNGAHEMAPRGPVAPALITEEHRTILRQMVDRNASPAQIEMLIVVGNRYDLDPLMGHVVLINGKCFVTHKGLMHKAHTSGQFDGIETGYGVDDLGEWCECRVWRKDMGRPFVGRIYVGEYRNSGPVWKQYPRAMAAKTAESFVLRRAFDVSLTSQEEMGVGEAAAAPEEGALPDKSGAWPDARVTRDGTPRAERTPPAERAAPAEAPGGDPIVEERFRKVAQIHDLLRGMDAAAKKRWRTDITSRKDMAYAEGDVRRLNLGQLDLIINALKAGFWPDEAPAPEAEQKTAAAESDPFADDDFEALVAEDGPAALLTVPVDRPGHGDT